MPQESCLPAARTLRASVPQLGQLHVRPVLGIPVDPTENGPPARTCGKRAAPCEWIVSERQGAVAGHGEVSYRESKNQTPATTSAMNKRYLVMVQINSNPTRLRT